MVERRLKRERMRWEKRILKWLEKNGPHFRYEIKEDLNVPKDDERNFYRAIKRLINFGVLTEQGDGRIARVGYQHPERISISIGPRPLRISLPVPTGTAKRILDRRPAIKLLLTRRKGPAYEVLSELGII